MFVITGLPRSRTAWFSAYLTYDDVICYHEAIYNNQRLTGRNGTADSGYVFCPDWALELGPHKLVIIHRNHNEVAKSVREINIPDEVGYLPAMAEQLHNLNGLHINFYDIDERLEDIHNYLDLPYNKERAKLFSDMNIQSMNWGH